jgi:hypothetical protein
MVHFHQPPAQSQPYAHPAMVAGEVGISRSEHSAEMLDDLLRYPGSSFTDPESNGLRPDFRGDLNPPAGRGELDGVEEKVQQNLPAL